jgi:hypothetical protein
MYMNLPVLSFCDVFETALTIGMVRAMRWLWYEVTDDELVVIKNVIPSQDMYACYETSLPLQCEKEMAILQASKTKIPSTGCKGPPSWGFNLPHMTNESLMGGVRRRILRRVGSREVRSLKQTWQRW